MEYLAEFLLSGDRFNSMIATGVMGGIGGLIGYLIGSQFKSDGLKRLVPIVCVVLAIQVPKAVKPYLQESYKEVLQEKELNKTFNEIEKQRLITVLFYYHPEAKAEFRASFDKAILNKSAIRGGVEAVMQQELSNIVAKYFEKHLMAASDESIYNLLQRNLANLKKFQGRPELCVGYYLGNPRFAASDLTPEFLTEEGNLKADVIESSVKEPSLPPQAANLDELANTLLEGYTQKGYSPDGLSKIGDVGTLPPIEGCRVAIEFSDVIASLDQNAGPRLFKNLTYLGQQ